MARTFKQLSIEDRCEIARRRAEGQSIRKIAADLDRQASSISRERKRNSGKTIGYKPSNADQQAKARRWKGQNLLAI
jgi:IS30 family transposase